MGPQDAGDERVARLCARLRSASSAAAYEAAGKGGDMEPAIRAIVSDVLCVGPAHTVLSRGQHAEEMAAAADVALPGSVLVIDVGEDSGLCAWGGTGTLIAQRRGLAGCVTNGYVRDSAEIRRARFPVFARGATVRGWRRLVPGSVNVPVVVGGQAVQPGDLICADDDGVVVIAQSRFDAFERALDARLRFEAQAEALVRDGRPYTEIIASKPG